MTDNKRPSLPVNQPIRIPTGLKQPTLQTIVKQENKK